MSISCCKHIQIYNYRRQITTAEYQLKYDQQNKQYQGAASAWRTDLVIMRKLSI